MKRLPKRISKFGLVQVGERAAARSWKSKKQVLLVLNVLGSRGPLIVQSISDLPEPAITWVLQGLSH